MVERAEGRLPCGFHEGGGGINVRNDDGGMASSKVIALSALDIRVRV